jgi:pilus assembly protein CpaC
MIENTDAVRRDSAKPRNSRMTSAGARGMRAALLGLGALIALPVTGSVVSGEAWAQAPTNGNGTEVRIQRRAGLHAGEFVVAINKSQILRLDVPFTNISIGNPKIADVLALTDRTMYILGKGLGSTSLTIFGRNRRLIAVADLVVTYDVESIKARLHELLPKEKLEVRSVGNSIVLGGYVSSGAAADQAMKVASRFAPGKVTNMMRVAAAQQVMLQVRFAEVRRSALKELGISLKGTVTGTGRASGNLFTSPNSGVGDFILGSGSTSATSFISGTLGLAIGNLTLSALFDALETKGFSRTLAEPTLVALSGDTASFLAGGEYPIQTVEEESVKVTYKEFGISLAFTPTVLDRNRINLVVRPEVSTLDFDLLARAGTAALSGVTGFDSIAITQSGSPAPPLSTRRANTTVELGDGQSFAIAGLISNEFDDSISQVPWLGSIPVLGALMRSTDFQRLETELVMVVTPYIVKPVSRDAITLPTDKFIPPAEQDVFLMGKIRQDVPNVGRSMSGGRISARGSKTSGGLAGAHGHIVE